MTAKKTFCCVCLLSLLTLGLFYLNIYATGETSSSEGQSSAASVSSNASSSQTSSTTSSRSSSSSTSSSAKKIEFKSDNPNKVDVTKSVTLYIVTQGINPLKTTFKSSNTTIASVQKVNDSSVKVVGLADGKVKITATADGITASFDLTVGTGVVSSKESVSSAAQSSEDILTTLSDTESITSEYIPVGLVSSDDIFDNIKPQKLSFWNILLGGLAWVVIIFGICLLFLVIIRNKKPRNSMYPASKMRRYAKRSGMRKRLLPDSYYRNIRKW